MRKDIVKKIGDFISRSNMLKIEAIESIMKSKIRNKYTGITKFEIYYNQGGIEKIRKIESEIVEIAK